jgi:hypothetical protein
MMMTCEATMKDPTEAHRRWMIESGQPARDLAAAGQRWTTEEMHHDFAVVSFLAPFVVVRRRADGVTGCLEFTHLPRWYFNFVPDRQ